MASDLLTFYNLRHFNLDFTVSDTTKQPHLNFDTASELTELPSDDDHPSSSSPSPSPSPAPSPNNLATLAAPSPAGNSTTPPHPQHTDEGLSKNRKKRRKQIARRAGVVPGRKDKMIAKLQGKHRRLAEKIFIDVDSGKLKRSKPGYIGIKVGDEEPPDIDWVLVPREEGPNPRTVALVDSKGRIFAICTTPSGHCAPSDFAEGLLSAVMELNRSRGSTNSAANSRSEYKNLTFGLSYGGGSKAPSQLRVEEGNVEALERYKSNEYVQDCAHRVKNFFHNWSPGLFKYYETTLSGLETKHELQRPFPELPFAASTVNFGPRVITRRHKDFKNLGFGLCAIVVLGHFNYKTGGKIRLEEAGVEIEVAPGDVLIIPSGSITHSNTPIGLNETHCSVMFYSSGQMFRWAKDGYRPVKSLTRMQRRRGEANGGKFWKSGWNLYLRVRDLPKDEDGSEE